jgi:hypothetical protein
MVKAPGLYSRGVQKSQVKQCSGAKIIVHFSYATGLAKTLEMNRLLALILWQNEHLFFIAPCSGFPD